jgi:hypothetical protein
MDKKVFRTREEAEKAAADVRGFWAYVIPWTDDDGTRGWVVECRIPGPAFHLCQDGGLR